MADYKVISSDSHVYEPRDLWTSRIEPRFRDRAPRVVRLEDGSDWWICEDIKLANMGNGAQAGVRFEESGRSRPEKLRRTYTFEEVRPGGYIPEEHVKDMDIDGVDVGILYTTAGLLVYTVPDGDLVTEIFSTYNDWLAEFCRPFPGRLKGIGMVNIDDVRDGIRELERCANMGLVGAMVPLFPPPGRSYESPEYDPLWAAAQDLGMPLSLHVGTHRAGPDQSIAGMDATSPSSQANVDHWVRMSLGDMIFSGVFERYPTLQVGSVEQELAWAPHFLSRLDDTYTQRVGREFWHRYNEDMLPSEYFHRNVFLSFQEEGLGIEMRHHIGVDNLLWGSDYPHAESTFPESQRILEEILVDCTEEEKAKIAGGNAARIYHLD